MHLLDVVARRCIDCRVPGHEGVGGDAVGSSDGIAVVARLGSVPFGAARDDTSLSRSRRCDSSARRCASLGGAGLRRAGGTLARRLGG